MPECAKYAPRERERDTLVGHDIVFFPLFEYSSSVISAATGFKSHGGNLVLDKLPFSGYVLRSTFVAEHASSVYYPISRSEMAVSDKFEA